MLVLRNAGDGFTGWLAGWLAGYPPGEVFVVFLPAMRIPEVTK